MTRMTCSLCDALLCVECIKVADIPVVEEVLAKAAMESGCTSYTDIVTKLWGREIASSSFGPMTPPPTREKGGATLNDLGNALTPLSSSRRVRPGCAAFHRARGPRAGAPLEPRHA